MELQSWTLIRGLLGWEEIGEAIEMYLDGKVFVAIDLRTIGVDREGDAIIRAEAMRFNKEGILDEFSCLITVKDQLTLSRIKGELIDFIGDSPLLGYNLFTRFDLPFLERHRKYDVSRMAPVRHLGEHSLESLARHLGIHLERPHGVLNNAEATMKVFVKLLEKLEKRDSRWVIKRNP